MQEDSSHRRAREMQWKNHDDDHHDDHDDHDYEDETENRAAFISPQS